MSRFHAMHVFVAVAEVGSFAAAARRLNISPPAATRAIALLEDAIGARLLVRTTRSVKLTESGARYLGDCRRILADIAEAEAAASGSYLHPQGNLKVTASVLFGQEFMVPILTDFLDAHPDVSIEALFVDRVTHIVEEGIDVAVRIGHLPDSSLSAIRVGSVRRVVCGSPHYFARHGMPREPDDLSNHNIIASSGTWSSPEWKFGKDGALAVRVTPRLSCSTFDAVIQATIQGWGLARPLSYQIGRDVRDGRLMTVLQDFEQPPLPIHIVHPDGHRAPAKVRAFIDYAVERLRADPLIA